MEAFGVLGILGFIFGGAAMGVAGKAKSKANELEERIRKLEMVVQQAPKPQGQ